MKIPASSAINPLEITRVPLTSYNTVPVLNSSPTNWSNLYFSLKVVQGINASNTADHKTIASVDPQLCYKCIQLKANNIGSSFVFRLGKLHVLFAMLKVIRKNMKRSGLDDALMEADIHGATTMEQIKSR